MLKYMRMEWMNLDTGLLILSFFAGILGTFLGGTQTFVCTGFIGILVAVLSFMGISIPFLNDVILNVLFLPCVIFNGAGVATAYAAKHHNIRGTDTNKSLLFTKDYKVFLCGGIFGLIGYLLFSLFTYLKLPLDIGGLVVIILGVFGRATFGQQWIVDRPLAPNKNILYQIIISQGIFAVIISLITVLLVHITGIESIGFSISAASLLFTFKYASFPATHQISMVVGYAYMHTHNIVLSVVFGVIAHLICTAFGTKCNTVECGTHIDPPAVAIASLSFIIFTLF